jgi:hypothetical protein
MDMRNPGSVYDVANNDPVLWSVSTPSYFDLIWSSCILEYGIFSFLPTSFLYLILHIHFSIEFPLTKGTNNGDRQLDIVMQNNTPSVSKYKMF